MTETNMTAKSIRVPQNLWATAMEKANDEDTNLSTIIRDALTKYAAHCTECGCDTCGLDTFDMEDTPEGAGKVSAIVGYGKLHTDTTDPATLALVARAAELLREGAVAVSVATDLNPADLDPALLLEGGEPDWDKIAEAGIRLRHVAIEDTAAFSDARMTYSDDGTVEGPITFEGVPTGDLRILPYHSLLWEDTLPITLKMGHDGPVIGVIDRIERVEGVAASGAAPVTASTGVFPAGLFAQPQPGPFTIGQPDASGYRHVYGTLAPAGVCHKGKNGTCLTYKGASLDYFHSGSAITLDNGNTLRVGPLVAGGLHTDDQNLDYNAALHAVADSRSVFAMGRAYDTPKGLLFSGILLPDVPDKTVPRLMACAPSVELWPDHRGRLELKTALMVPRPGFPVAASLGAGGVALTEADPVAFELEEDTTDAPVDLAAALDALGRLEKAVGTLLAAHVTASLAD